MQESNGRSAKIIFGVYLGYLILLALAPFTLSMGDSLSLLELYKNKFEGMSSIVNLSAWDVWTNILLFMPFGALIVAFPALSSFSWWLQILLISISAGLVSLGLELGQLFVPRRPSLADVVCNTLGAGGGALLMSLAKSRLAMLDHQWSSLFMRGGKWGGACLALYLAILFGIFSLPLPLYFINWDEDSPFQLGNEATLDRPWHGTMYMVAVYDRALNTHEVKSNFFAGPYTGSAKKRIDQGLVVFYDFSEGAGDTVHDRLVTGSPVHLQIHDPANARWLSPNGLLLASGTQIVSTQPAVKLSSRLSAGDELSVESWIAPASLSQGGPARIISYSNDTNHRNFTLGQEEREIIFRLRTPVSGPNGTQPQLRTVAQPLKPAIQHLVVTFRNGTETLYVDGVEIQRTELESRVALIDAMLSLLGWEFKYPLWSLFLFPLGLISYVIQTRRRCSDQVIGASLITGFIGLAIIVGPRLLPAKNIDKGAMMVAIGSIFISIFLAPLLVNQGLTSTDQDRR